MATQELTQLAGYADMLDELHGLFKPHQKQVEIARDLFFGGVKRMMLCLARRVGKSALICYVSVRWALTRPGSHVFIVGPGLASEREVILASGLLLNMIPRKYLADYNKTESRVTFTNGSFIRILGADNPDSLRGIRASLCALDELKDIKREVLEIIMPTLIDEDAPLILCGTPPEVAEHPFWGYVEEAQQNPDWRFYHATSYDNPYLKKEAIDKERASFEKRGDLDVFIREFEARYVPGGKRAVFPMLTQAAHVFPWTALWNRIQRTPEQWLYYCTLDPGTASCFAATLHAVNPYRGLVYVMDEVYEQQQGETSIGKIWPRIKAKMDQIYIPEFDESPWTVTVDEAATWARNELLDQFGVPSFPTTKAAHRKADGVSLIKDLLRSHKMLLSDRCVATFKEMAGYMLDKNGNYVKKNDHAIDTLRYTLAAANYTFQESTAPERPEAIPSDERKQTYTPEEDFREAFGPIYEPYLMDLLD